MKFSNPFKSLQKAYKVEILGGWFKDSFGRNADTIWGSYGRGPVRLTAKGKRKASTFDIITYLKASGRDIVNTPLKKMSPELERCADFLAQLPLKTKNVNAYRSGRRQIINLVKAIFTVPMLQGKYKKEKASTIQTKGFSRPSIDTGFTAKQVDVRIIKK